MEKEANYFTVGVFVSVTLLALVGFSIWLAGVHDLGHHDRYTVYFTDPDGHRFEFFCETVPDDEEGKRVLGAYNAPSEPVVIDPLYT